MASLTEHVMINRFSDDLDDAIRSVGGNTESVVNITQYPDIIRQQLHAYLPIEIDKYILEDVTCVIHTNENGEDTYDTEYASGVMTGLSPDTLYIRICTTIKDLEPIYIDMTPVLAEATAGDINAVIVEIFKNPSFVSNINDIISEYMNNWKNDINNVISQKDIDMICI